MVLQETCMPDSNDLLGYAIIIAMGVVFFVFYMVAVFVKLPMKLMLSELQLLVLIIVRQ